MLANLLNPILSQPGYVRRSSSLTNSQDLHDILESASLKGCNLLTLYSRLGFLHTNIWSSFKCVPTKFIQFVSFRCVSHCVDIVNRNEQNKEYLPSILSLVVKRSNDIGFDINMQYHLLLTTKEQQLHTKAFSFP